MSTREPESLHPEIIVVSCTVPDESSAQRIADLVLNQQLAACVQSHPITSQYRWDGEVQRNQEIMLTMKTTTERYPALESAIASEHPYEVPEIVAVPIARGSQAYLDWVAAEASGV